MSKAWFEQWFDTKYYHILYSHRDEGEARNFLTNLMHFLGINKGAHVIDIGCGRGRHAKFLSEMGFEVTGIDIAASNIDFAKQYEDKHLHFHCFDKRNVFSKSEFDLGLNLFTSYGYLKSRSELEGALRSMAQNIKKHGLFVMDYMNAEKIKHSPMHNEVIETQGIRFELSRKISGHQVIKEISILENASTGHYTEEVHLITLEEFKELFAFASLKILHTFGDYDLGEYNEVNSDRLILIAEKI